MLGKLLAGMLLLAAACGVQAGQTGFKMITLQHRLAQDVLPVVQAMVGEGGTASAIDNHLVIRTTPERLAAIEEAIAKLDVTPRNVRIEISHDSSLARDETHAGISGRGRIGRGEVIAGDHAPAGNGIRLDIGQGSSHMEQHGSEFVTVMDGARAFIRVGQSVPFTQQWAVFTQRYAHIGQATGFRDVTTGFAVVPRYIGDEVEVEITPRIARLNGSGTVDFEELSTTLRVRPGQWFDLGGTMQSRDEVSRAILNSGSDTSAGSTGLMLKVD